MEEVFGLTKLRDAANASNLADLFSAIAAGGPTGGVGPDGHSRPRLTPGLVLTTDLAKICTSGYSRTVRSVDAAEKAQVAAAYTFTGASSSVEYDHLISLELGGSNDLTNLWPEPIADAHVKDGLVAHLRSEVCAPSCAARCTLA